MEIRFGINEVTKILEDYYKTHEDFEGKVKFECRIGSGFCRNETYEVVELNAVIEGKLSVYGMEVPMVRTITPDEMKTVFRSVVEETGQTVSGVMIDYGNNKELVGYGLAERIESKPYFNGVKVTVRNKTYAKTWDYQGR